MPRRGGSLHNSNQAIQALAESAKTSADAIFVETAIRSIGISSLPPETRATFIEAIARNNLNTTNVMVASLTTLALIDPVTTRRLAHEILAERFHPERDVILARAASALVELSPPDPTDLPFITKALTSRLDLINAATKRALSNLVPSRCLALLTVARSAVGDPGASHLVKFLEERISNGEASLPPRPAEPARRPPTQRQAPEVIRPARDVTFRTPQPPVAPRPLPSREQPCVQETTPLSLVELKMIANTSKDHAQILSSITKIVTLHGREHALDCLNGFVWATSDPKNPLKAEFNALSHTLFSNQS